MKQILTALAIVAAVSATAQFIPNNGMGYRKTGKSDTVKAVLLITKCNDCQAYSMSGFAVREQYVYYGDRMGNGNDYNDRWDILFFLDKRKLPFDTSIIIWDHKLLTP